jgi:hypothetical protein
MPRIIVEVGKQMDGATFRLSPKTRAFLRSHFEDLPSPSSIFVSDETASDFAHYHGPMWEHLVMILTGLNEKQLSELDGFEFVTPMDGKVLFESSPVR